jgi:hypothetical protein
MRPLKSTMSFSIHVAVFWALAQGFLIHFSFNPAIAGIVVSGDPTANQRAIDTGFGYSVDGGGNVGSIAVRSELGTFYSSLVFINPYTAISSAHQFGSGFGLNQSYSIGSSANYNGGSFHTPSNVFTHPTYGGAGSGIDLAVIQFNSPVPLSNNLLFATERPALNETVWLAGYGVSGSRDVGYLPQDGLIRAGTSIARNSPPILGGSPLYYQNALFEDDPFFPTSLRGMTGDSGGGVFRTNGEFYGLIIGGSLELAGSTSMFLNTSNPDVRSFIDQYTITSVPEPNSLLLLAGGLAIASYRVRGRFHNKRPNKAIHRSRGSAVS